MYSVWALFVAGTLVSAMENPTHIPEREIESYSC